jgi:NAD(P)-dependent dehydrogenase (short-subunit alcohol dehydrogenase family)
VVNLSSGLGQLSDMDRGSPAYRISKTAVNALTRILAVELADTPIKVNAVCPGWCRTELGGHNASRSPEEGIDTVIWLATLPPDGPTGGFFRDRQPIPW